MNLNKRKSIDKKTKQILRNHFDTSPRRRIDCVWKEMRRQREFSFLFLSFSFDECRDALSSGEEWHVNTRQNSIENEPWILVPYVNKTNIISLLFSSLLSSRLFIRSKRVTNCLIGFESAWRNWTAWQMRRSLMFCFILFSWEKHKTNLTRSNIFNVCSTDRPAIVFDSTGYSVV